MKTGLVATSTLCMALTCAMVAFGDFGLNVINSRSAEENRVYEFMVNVYDLNEDKIIDFSEVFAKCKGKASANIIGTRFQVLDSNNDGSISRKEVASKLDHIKRSIDINNDREISTYELVLVSEMFL